MLLSIWRGQSDNVNQYTKEEEMKVRNIEDTGVQLPDSSYPKAIQHWHFLQLVFCYLKAKIPTTIPQRR